MSNISRRSFLKASGATIGVSAVGAGLMGLAGCSPNAESVDKNAAEMQDQGQEQNIKVKLVACSPTGTTLAAGLLLAEKISNDVEVIDQTSFASRQKTIEFDPEDLAILIGPTIVGRLPQVDDIFTNLVGNGASCIAAACFGNRGCELGVPQISEIATEDGFNVIGGIAMVTDHTLGGVLGRGRPDIEDRKVIESFAADIKDKFTSNTLDAITIEVDEKVYEDPYFEKIFEAYPPGVLFPSTAEKVYNEENCVKCGTCAAECTAGCIDPDTLEIDNEVCVSCQRCTSVCAYRARYFMKDRTFENGEFYWSRKDLQVYV